MFLGRDSTKVKSQIYPKTKGEKNLGKKIIESRTTLNLTPALTEHVRWRKHGEHLCCK